MRINTVYKQGGTGSNDDAYVINEQAGVLAAIDGATGLDGIPGHLASHTVQTHLQAMTPSHGLWESIADANKAVNGETIGYYQTHIRESIARLDDIPKNQRSSTGLAAIQLHPDHHHFHYIHAGDCMLFLKYENGDIRPVTYDLIQYLDQQAITELVKQRQKNNDHNLDITELRNEINPILLHNRNQLNTMNGYGVIDGSDEAMDHLEYGRLSLKRVTHMLLLSDGLLLPTELNDDNAWLQSASIAFDYGIDGLLHAVEEREMADEQCRIYPRLKPSDDKTGLLVTF
ncbi:hypothetical protein GCM10008983_08010 [Lentibacillus halophilus]|uniref:Protein phosphatase 2C n=1 Tax=Lentibacillus halophilus TaxID=295065 RepID=A0ABP3IZ13_9BACI